MSRRSPGTFRAAATPAAAETGPNLAITVVAGPGRRLPGDTVPIDLTITNTGDAAATDVWASTSRESGPYLSIPDQAWSDLRFSGPRTTFAPGETRTYHLPATVSYSDLGDAVVEFDGLPVGPGYSLHFAKVPDNWQLPYLPPLRLDGSGANVALEVPGVRPLSESLTAAIVLDKASYAVGETAKATVTLTNTDDRPLTGVFAGCDPGGSGRAIAVPNAQWGTFDPEHPAGQLAAGPDRRPGRRDVQAGRPRELRAPRAGRVDDRG